MRLILTTLVAIVGIATAPLAATFGPLVEADDLANALDTKQPVLLDIRNDGYADSHVDGALWAPYKLFRGTKDNPGGLMDLAVLEEHLEKLGLEQDEPIIIISEGNTDTDFGAAARVYWTLKSTGFTDLSILNGGRIAWRDANLPLNNTLETAVPSQLDLKFDTTWLADTQHVSSVVKGENSGLLVDARLPEFFAGDKAHGAAKRPGTLPGAVNQSYATFFENGAAAISTPTDISALKASLGIKGDEEVISFCNTGHWAATHWFALSELANVENAKLYAGSMVEYSNADLPMENTPGVFKNLLRQIGF
ncbi:sulfurtransferase [Nereida ignava]|uniref:Putative thiosulfate sulfurtransferase n=1 Tax=Nereida ignava TaxID=282199 RepID=A0A0U1NP85_9RHOB|nr:rhodanese-like domain-containing protein [Nereida ignava]CRK76550.1 Putative thiosulfate sulfurtransferase precursor [Nereida ignava]SFJ74123.1 thiosulfate/3-mercaptopyruvate sulfurtransferase [Nereida ignava DSM 16309]